MRRTKAASDPSTASASATAASLALSSRSCRTVRRSPARSPRVDGVEVRVGPAPMVTTRCCGSRSSTSRAVITLVVDAIGRARAGSLASSTWPVAASASRKERARTTGVATGPGGGPDTSAGRATDGWAAAGGAGGTAPTTAASTTSSASGSQRLGGRGGAGPAGALREVIGAGIERAGASTVRLGGRLGEVRHGGAQGGVAHAAAQLGERLEGLARPGPRLRVALAHQRRHHLLEQGRLALGADLVHAQVPGLQPVVGQVAGEPQHHQVLAAVPAPPLTRPTRGDQPELLQLGEPVDGGAGRPAQLL